MDFCDVSRAHSLLLPLGSWTWIMIYDLRKSDQFILEPLLSSFDLHSCHKIGICWDDFRIQTEQLKSSCSMFSGSLFGLPWIVCFVCQHRYFAGFTWFACFPCCLFVHIPVVVCLDRFLHFGMVKVLLDFWLNLWNVLLDRCGVGYFFARWDEPCKLRVCCLPEFEEHWRCTGIEWG